MRFSALILLLLLCISSRAQAVKELNSKYDWTQFIYSDSAFYGKGNNVYLLNDNFAFKFTDSTTSQIQIADLSKFKFFNITLHEDLSDWYQNMTAQGAEDSMHIVVFKAEMEGYGPIGFTAIFYHTKAQIYSVSFGSIENFIIIRLKPHTFLKK